MREMMTVCKAWRNLVWKYIKFLADEGKYILTKHQAEALSWIKENVGFNFIRAPMSAGKTAIGIVAAIRFMRESLNNKVVIIVPSKTVETWAKEIDQIYSSTSPIYNPKSLDSQIWVCHSKVSNIHNKKIIYDPIEGINPPQGVLFSSSSYLDKLDKMIALWTRLAIFNLDAGPSNIMIVTDEAHKSFVYSLWRHIRQLNINLSKWILLTAAKIDTRALQRRLTTLNNAPQMIPFHVLEFPDSIIDGWVPKAKYHNVFCDELPGDEDDYLYFRTYKLPNTLDYYGKEYNTIREKQRHKTLLYSREYIGKHSSALEFYSRVFGKLQKSLKGRTLVFCPDAMLTYSINHVRKFIDPNKFYNPSVMYKNRLSRIYKFSKQDSGVLLISYTRGCEGININNIDNLVLIRPDMITREKHKQAIGRVLRITSRSREVHIYNVIPKIHPAMVKLKLNLISERIFTRVTKFLDRKAVYYCFNPLRYELIRFCNDDVGYVALFSTHRNAARIASILVSDGHISYPESALTQILRTTSSSTMAL